MADAPAENRAISLRGGVDAILYEFKNDPREAIRALLSDLATLAADYEASVSTGFVRGEIPRLKRRA